MACLAPRKLADGTEVACRECKLCQLKAKNDWVGRNIAESKTAKFCYLITATYGRGRVGELLHERAVILTYSDCQKLLKLLRRHGYKVRFFITGEYGSERQRAHWNIILYSDKPLPAFSGWDQYGRWTRKARLEQRFNWVRTDERGDPVKLQSGEPAYWWPHGFVYISDVSVGNIQYACKYVLKDFDANGKQGHKGQSKDPPLGTKWFQQIAEKYVEQGLAPQTPAYRFPEARTKEGVVIDFWLKGRPLEMYLRHYLDTWAAKHGDKPHPPSQMLELFEQYGRVVNDEARMLERRDNRKGMRFEPMPTPEEWHRHIEAVADAKRVRAAEARQEWLDDWVNEASNEQERQGRQEYAERERERVANDFVAAQHDQGKHWKLGRGWFKRSGSEEPCDCCDVSAGDAVERGEHSAGPSGLDGHSTALSGRGKVGRWNDAYGTRSGDGENPGETRAGSDRPGEGT